MAPKTPKRSTPSTTTLVKDQAPPILTLQVRPFPNSLSHKTFLRVHVHRAILKTLDISPGSLVLLSPAPDPAEIDLCLENLDLSDSEDKKPQPKKKAPKQWPAQIWISSDPQLQVKSAQLGEWLRTKVGLGFADKIVMKRYADDDEGYRSVREVKVVEVEEMLEGKGGKTAGGDAPMEEREKEGWRWFLEHVLGKSYPSVRIMLKRTMAAWREAMGRLELKNIEFKAVRRSFKVIRIEPARRIGAPKDAPNPDDDREEGFTPAFYMTDRSFVRFTGASAPTDPSLAEVKPKKKASSSKKTPTLELNPEVKPPSPQHTEGALLKASGVTFSSIGGLAPQILSLRKLLLATLKRSSKFTKFGLTPPRGILLYGPPGTGKTMLIKACAAEIHATPYVISGSIVGKYMGESEAALRKVFKEARENQPSIVFIDEIDALVPKRGVDTSEGRIVSTLIMELDSLAAAANAEDGEVEKDEAGEPKKKKPAGNQVVIVAATNRPNQIDPALRRPGRFDREIEIGIPDVDARGDILELLLKKVPRKFDERYIKNIASRTHGFVGADLESLVRGAVMVAMSRLEEQEDLDVDLNEELDEDEDGEEDIGVTESDFEAALKDVRPTAMREIFLETPKVRWTDIGGQEEVKQRLRETVEWPLTHPEEFTRLGATPRKGLLLYGPPGCSKTLTAKALATEAGLNFMAVKGPELFSMYVGESERAVREIFRKARAASPSIIFFDEIDALSGTREGGGKSGSGVGSSVLAALLNEMDGIEQLKSVTILAATNRPDMIDPALLRPGRLDTLLYIPPPSRSARLQILQIQSRKIRFSPLLDLEELADRTEGYSGAEIVNICNEAVLIALRKGWREGEKKFEVEDVGQLEFEEALRGQMRGITEEMKRRYVEWGAARGA